MVQATAESVEPSANLSDSPATRRPALAERAFAPVPLDSLVVFRVWFGLLMLLDAVSFMSNGWVETTFIEPPFLFKYYFFEWVHPWPGQGMHFHFVALVMLSFCIMTGLFYRVASVLFAIGVTYVFLLEKAIYLNHMYLICLLSWIMAVVPCHRMWSLDVLRRPEIRSETAPAWSLWLVRFQIAIPYVFGGIAKLERDWLSGDTVTMFFLNDVHRPLIGPYMTSSAVVMLVTWGGLLFDLLIVPLLFWKRTRVPVFVVAVLFHISNSVLFQIGVFPWLMIGATLIFFPADWPRQLLRQAPWMAATGCAQPGLTRRQRTTVVLLGVYMLIQLTLPLRQFMYPGNPSWTDEGHTFCWRMMLRRKLTDASFMSVDRETGRQGRIAAEQFLNPRQIRNMSRSPDLLLQFSHFLERTLRDEFGYEDVAIHAAVKVSLNGRQSQFLIDPSVDLTEQQRSLRHADWIQPLIAPPMSEERKRKLQELALR